MDMEISIHALLAESDGGGSRYGPGTSHFYPRSPCGERPLQYYLLRRGRHFYPRSPCGERPFDTIKLTASTSDFYPRSPCGERRAGSCPVRRGVYFYPRSPCGERRPPPTWTRTTNHFYPRSPCGERRMPQPLRVFDYSISIHALLAESDRRCSCCPPLSTISIHALLAESDPG